MTHAYVVVYSAALEREAIRAQQKVMLPSRPPQSKRQRYVRERALNVVRSLPSRWWTGPEVWEALGCDLDRTWVNTVLRDFHARGLLTREMVKRIGGGRVWRYRVKS